MHRKYFLELADYQAWADNRVIDWLNQVSEEQWEQVTASSFGSIKQTAVHIASAEKIWIDYWKNVPDPVFLSAVFNGTKHDLTETWKRITADLKNFIEECPEENYLQPVSFRWPGGKEGRMAFWQTFSHCINHATYHRGQLVTLLRQVGFTKLSSTDLAAYYCAMQK
jgi:uncharacterized damage-inducible protein DinB